MAQTPLYAASRGTDSYKFSHHKQYPPGTSHIYSYVEARKAPSRWSGKVLFFGLQYLLQRYMVGKVVDHKQIDVSVRRAAAHFGSKDIYNEAGWRKLVDKHNGRLPLSIKALPEGTIVPIGTPLFTVENTDDEFHWLTNWFETLLVQVWQMSTVATNSWECKTIIRRGLEQSGADLGGLPFKLHDFGYRGCGSIEEAATAGAAHLVSFLGTDTFAAIDMLYDFYGATDETMPGFSIPASEHSTIASWGREGELHAFKNMLEQYPEGLVACVSDTFDIWNACKNYWGVALKPRILHRKGTLVVRPDSGPLPETLLGVLDTLGKAFGTETNSLGFKVLPPQVRVIQGDGIDKQMLSIIIDEMLEKKWSIDNIAFGSGGGLLRKLDRDTLGFACKASSATVDGVERDVYKDPITDPGKKSKRGRQAVIRGKDGIETWSKVVGADDMSGDLLKEVFRDGKLLEFQTLEQIRKVAEAQ